VVQRHHHYLMRVCQPEQADAYQRPAAQVERPPRLFQRQPLNLRPALGFVLMAKLHHFRPEGKRAGDNLHWLSVNDGEGRAQHFMPPDDFAQALFQRDQIERPLKPRGAMNVIG
jgi:hypothetical protein